MGIYLIIIGLYFIFIVAISFFTRKIASKSATEFLIAGRNLGLVSCAVVVAAEWLGGMSTIGISEKAFKLGNIAPALYNISTATGMVIIGFTVAYHYRKYKVYTVGEMLQHLFGKDTRTIASLAFLFAYIVLSFVQLQSFASVTATIFKIKWLWAVLIASAVITTYTYIGGMHAIALTNILHFLVMYTGIVTALLIGLHKVGGFSFLNKEFPKFYNIFAVKGGLNYIIALFLGGVLGGMAAQASIQPIFAAKDPKTAKKSAFLSALLIAPFGIMTAILGLIAKSGVFYKPEELVTLFGKKMASKMVLPYLLINKNFIPPVLGGLALAGIMAAILSTIGPVNFAIITIVTKDFYHNLLNIKADEKKLLEVSKKLVILVNLITIPLALFVKKAILDAAYISYAIRAIGAIVILLGIYAMGRFITKTGAKLAFIGGTISVFLCVIAKSFGWFYIDKTYGAIISSLLFIIIGLIVDSLKRRGNIK